MQDSRFTQRKMFDEIDKWTRDRGPVSLQLQKRLLNLRRVERRGRLFPNPIHNAIQLRRKIRFLECGDMSPL